MTAVASGCSSDFTRNNWSLYTKGLDAEQGSNSAYSSSLDDTTTSAVGNRKSGPSPLPAQDVDSQILPDNGIDTSGEYSPYQAVRQNGVARSELPPPQSAGNGWTSGGKTVVNLQEGETLYNLSKRYGVPVSAIMAANGIGDAGQVAAGQEIQIPTYNYSASAPISAPDNNRHTQNARSTSGSTIVPTLASVPAPKWRPEAGEARQLAYAPATQDAAQSATSDRTQTPQKTRRVESAPLDEKDVSSQPEAPAQTGIGQFRWPVRGRVISTFGEKSTTGRNDGIDISVPEGTAVKAAENGVVVYAGDELEGFGNLLLVRHSDGWVSAYAHNKQLEVGRGDKIRRGQIIARSGRTGNADMPKLHFELRKSSEPVDPLKYLGGA